jgi:cell division transport system permease protein
MTRITFVFREFLRNLRRHPGTAFVSLLSLTLLFLLFDLFWVAAQTSERFYEDFLSDITIDVYVAESFPDSSIAHITGKVASVEGISSIEYITRERAREELARLVGTDLLVGYDSLNPLPRSFTLEIAPAYSNLSNILAVEKELVKVSGVDQIVFSRRCLEKAEETRSIILKIGLALGGLILLTALTSSSNNIRLMTRARAVGFRQMLLLGAPRLFIALPFVMEGFLLGGLSSTLGWMTILYVYGKVSFSQIEIVLPIMNDIVIFCLATATLGAISGYFGVRSSFKQIV